MKKNNSELNLAARLIGGTLFFGVFMFNIISFVNIDGGGISIKALKAYALSGGTGNEEESGKFIIRTQVGTSTKYGKKPDGTQCSQTQDINNVFCDPDGDSPCTPSSTPGTWSECI